MDAETLRKLAEADDPREWERPNGFDWHAAMAEIERLRPELERILGRPLELDRNVEDASFFTELMLVKPSSQPRVLETVVAVRFSAFGRLFTVWSLCSTEALPPATLESLVRAVERRGFIYIDRNALDQPYSGKHSGFAGEIWWRRYFDYV